MTIDFGRDFSFGVATASYQIEGGVREGGRGPSIWDTFAHTPGKTFGGDTGDVACDHFHRWDQDLDLMAELGVDAYRLSIAWPRIQADGRGSPNPAGLDFYSRLIDGLLARGIAPFVTAYHWDLPQALEDDGGWLNRDTAYRFADYVDVVARVLGDRVTWWAPLNEPWCVAMLGYAAGQHAPGRTSAAAGVRASHHLNLAHGLAVSALRSRVGGQVGAVVNLHQFYPAGDSDDDLAACARGDAIGNWIYTDPILRGVYDPLTLETTGAVSDWAYLVDGDLDICHQPLDFLGINYYTPNWVGPGVGPAEPNPWPGARDIHWLPARAPMTDQGWTIEPQGLTDLLVRVHQRYPELPFLITENGAAMADQVVDGQVHDSGRIDYIAAHLRAVAAARQQGVPVGGYFVWSFLDNFEWSQGYSQRLGLVRVEYDTQARIWKDSATWYQQLLRTRQLVD